MRIERRQLYQTQHWRLGQIDVKDASPEPGGEQQQQEHTLVMAVAGVFAKHDAARRVVVGTPCDAVTICADEIYRISYPDGIGDRCLTVRFSDETLSKLVDVPQEMGDLPVSSIQLPPRMMLMRNLLWYCCRSDFCEALEVDELCGLFVEEAIRLAWGGCDQRPENGRIDAVAAVKEAVTSNPAFNWYLSDLGREANVSPFHLSRIFRAATRMSLHEFVTRARLALALELLIETDLELTAIALESGFSSHSHFTARFRLFFGITPSALRRVALSKDVAKMRTIVTAPFN